MGDILDGILLNWKAKELLFNIEIKFKKNAASYWCIE